MWKTNFCQFLDHCVKSVQIRIILWSVFSHIRTEYGEIRSISPYSVRMRENTDQKILRIWTLFTQWMIWYLEDFNRFLSNAPFIFTTIDDHRRITRFAQWHGFIVEELTITNVTEEKKPNSFSSFFKSSLFKLFVWAKVGSIPCSSNKCFKYLRLWCRRKGTYFW